MQLQLASRDEEELPPPSDPRAHRAQRSRDNEGQPGYRKTMPLFMVCTSEWLFSSVNGMKGFWEQYVCFFGLHLPISVPLALNLVFQLGIFTLDSGLCLDLWTSYMDFACASQTCFGLMNLP